MRTRFRLAAALCSVVLSASAFAQYPEHPIKILVPFAPGGVADLLARVVAQKITDQTGKTVIVDNKTGAGGRIGYEAGAKAAADGYTFTATDVTYTMLPALYKSLPWNASADLVPVALLAQMPFVVAVRENAGVSTLPQLLAKAGAAGAKLNYGSAGVGSVNHVVTELFSKTAGVQMVNVPYRGMGEAVAALLGGSVDVLVTAMPTAMGQVRSGRIRALAVTAPARSPALPEAPTASEAGVKFVASNWIGLTAPKNTPAEAINWMQKAVAGAVATPEVKQNFLRQGAEPAAAASTRDDFERLMQSETARWAEVIHAAGITPTQ